ncbi:hypothetical protein [Qipengyuania sp. JC766]|uniref:hypothetical protein n=1 Tax=Qipengyuania sp. JC766 TaxID=3232139 RepID=UPI0034596C21
MRETLEIVLAITTGILFSGALVGLVILSICAVSAGGFWWLWSRRTRRGGGSPGER